MVILPFLHTRLRQKATHPYDFINHKTTKIIRSKPGLQLLDKVKYFPHGGHRINVGCGTYLTNWMFDCETNTDIRRRKLWKNFVRADVLDHGEMFDKNTFDYAFSSHLFEHLNIPQIKKAVKCLEKIARNVIILVPTGEHFLGQIYSDHISLWLEDGLASNRRSPLRLITTVQ